MRNIVCDTTKYATRIKTWIGDQVGYTLNGGDGGFGCRCFIENSSTIYIDLQNADCVVDIKNIREWSY